LIVNLRRNYFCVMIKQPIKQLAIAVCIFFASCAHQSAPGGGPDDKTSPSIVTISPMDESVNVNPKGRITIAFSEWISSKSDKGISIYPPVNIKTVVSRNKLDIIPLKGFKDSTTYHISITTQLLDLHNNPILSPLSITFSTGPSLDSGKLAGCIIDPSRKYLQPKVVLFKRERLNPDSMFTGTPDYLTQTDSLGLFEFKNIKNGWYYSVAFLDQNSDNRIQPSKEPVYSTSDSLLMISAKEQSVFLFPSSYDTTTLRLSNIKAQSSTILSGDWNIPLDPRSGYSNPSCYVYKIDTPSVVTTGTYIPLPNGKLFTLRLRTPMSIAPYNLVCKVISPTGKTLIDTLKFNGIMADDTTKSSARAVFPAASSVTDLEPKLYIIWSKPVIINTPVTLIDSTGKDTLFIKPSPGYSDTSFFPLKRRLQPDRKYKLVLMRNAGTDIAGNQFKAKDSTDTAAVIMFRTLNADSIAISLQGTASCLDKNLHRKWIFRLFNNMTSYIAKDSAGGFRFDSLQAGKGSLSYFDDYNENDKPDIGRLVPWYPSEAHFSAADTVEARARWDVEGVKINMCGQCEKKKTTNSSK
jgi:Bacterial Ig-like domain